MASLRSYEEVNGPVPEGPPIDANGLACQVRGSSNFGPNAGFGFPFQAQGRAPNINMAQRLVDNSQPPPDPQSMIDQDDLDNSEPSPEVQRMIDPNPIPDIPSMIDLDDIMLRSNEIPTADNRLFREQAAEAAEARRQQGYKADGSLNGPYSADNPPPGKKFNGYGKGCTHISWKNDGPSVSLLNDLFSNILPNGDTDTLRNLLSNHSIDVNLRIGKGPSSQHTMLHWCVTRNQYAMVELLLEFNADTTLTDIQARTAKDLALKEGNECLKLFF